MSTTHYSSKPVSANLPLTGILVVSIEQAVAAPLATCRLADAGARVIKIERPEGDFARGYDHAAAGEASYFVWTNRGKESLVLDYKQAPDAELLQRLLAKADVFVQNLAPGALTRAGFGSEDLRQRYPSLITCDISGYGTGHAASELKAYDLLVQAESGLIAVSGAPGEWGRIGVSLCDITAGMNALIGIQQALFQRDRTGRGSGIKVSLFDSAAELMGVPYLQTRHGGKAPERVGLKHPSIAPYGAFTCADGRDILVSIQNEREWADFCREVLRRPDLPTDPRFASNAVRVENRPLVDGTVAEVFAGLTSAEAIDRLTTARTAFGSVNSVQDLISHPQLRTRRMKINGHVAEVPALPWITEWDDDSYREMPGVNAQGEALRREFGGGAPADNPARHDTTPHRASTPV